MRCELIVDSRSTNGEWRFVKTLGSVFGSFFVVIAVISASSLLISLNMPDDVLSDVVDPIRTSPQSAVSVVAAGAPAFSCCCWCVGDADSDLMPSLLLLHCTENFNERFSKYRLSPANTFGIFDAHVIRVVVISILSSKFSSYSASTRTQRPCLSNTGSFALWFTFFRLRDRCDRTK